MTVKNLSQSKGKTCSFIMNVYQMYLYNASSKIELTFTQIQGMNVILSKGDIDSDIKQAKLVNETIKANYTYKLDMNFTYFILLVP